MRFFLAAALAALAYAPASAQDVTGEYEYMVACAGCHGESGKGDGPLAGLLEIHTPDLTRLTHRAGGTFPYQNTILLIDGRNEVRAHGSAMPIWGDRYQASATSQRGETADMVARGRILSLISYLQSIQE
jgi:mono/diheme cytochrome c family protein